MLQLRSYPILCCRTDEEAECENDEDENNRVTEGRVAFYERVKGLMTFL
jgi:hypothetical protein